jgi:hypothetical protein
MGPPGTFFASILEASRYVELYDETLCYEPWRRGVATAVVPPARLERQLEERRNSFCCLVGFSRVPDRFACAGSRILFSPLLRPPGGLHLTGGDVMIGAGNKKTGGGRAGATAITAREAVKGGTGPGMNGRGGGAVIVIDPHVMEPSLTGRGRNAPGTMKWYSLLGALAECFDGGSVEAVHLLPRALPPRDAYPSFVLARLVSRIIALALRERKRN